jgi:cytochrome c553
MTDKHKRIITQLKTHKLYTTYRAILNVYLHNFDKGKPIYAEKAPIFKYIKEENIQELIAYLQRLKQKTPSGDKQVENFKKYYFYKTKTKI